MSQAEKTFKTIVTKLIARDIYPAPTAINDARLGTHTSGRRNSINGRECQWRREVLNDAGWIYRFPQSYGYRFGWRKP
jgi:hypothetical protein